MGLFSSRDNGSRRADGKPENERDKKFFDLRASGETRPIDHRGEVVEDMDQWLKDHS